MERKVLVCMVSVVVLVCSSVVYGQDLCQKFHDRYRVCVEGQGAGKNMDYDVCKTFTDQSSCEGGGCYWNATKSKCIIDICLTDGTYDYEDGKVNLTDLGIYKNEYGRIDCPSIPDVPAPTPVPKTGQTSSYDTGDDGDLEKGVPWPNPRFNDNGDGTVTDNLTGLIWLKDAACFGIRRWGEALNDCDMLQDGYCGLSDGSISDDWRLPNRVALESLLDIRFYNPPLSNKLGTGQWSQNDPFNNVQPYYYWSSSTLVNAPFYAWSVDMLNGSVSGGFKDGGNYVWPVRGGQ
jgi:hypothetical protein